MTENQKMDLILQKLGGIEGGLASVGEDVRLLQGDVQSLKEDVQTLKEDVYTLKEDVQTLKEDVQSLKEDVQTKGNKHRDYPGKGDKQEYPVGCGGAFEPGP